MKRLATLILLVGLLAPALSGCFHNQIIVQDNYNASATEADWSKGWQTYLLWGLIPLGENPINVNQACPQGAGIVEVKQTFLNGLVSGLALGGLFSFQSVAVYCARAAAEIETDVDEIAAN